ELDFLCRRWGALLMVDEAHASGALGPQGRGLAAECGIAPEIQMGTLGKAAGTSGAYVAGSSSLIELLTNKARPLIYTTAASPGVLCAALEALKIISSEEGDQRRERLAENVRTFHELVNSGISSGAAAGHIVPVKIGDSSRTMKVSTLCLERGVFAHGIRFPTVPEGTARLRFTLMSDHTQADLRKAAAVLSEALESTPQEEGVAGTLGG
ncbi:MAG: aminotransferase class I/II-fold pyridoxal phosphate-dependent enzyme, partial [Desulfomonile tiedjei]|nr:aminotransferase class I/II-fold pyridoxal phosphate-dependent enzyme [Desulfomonile tiedjei]